MIDAATKLNGTSARSQLSVRSFAYMKRMDNSSVAKAFWRWDSRSVHM
jgi:hypothetical protein